MFKTKPMLLQKLRNYLNESNRVTSNSSDSRYINNLTCELSNHPVLENIWTLCTFRNIPLTFREAITYIFSWRKTNKPIPRRNKK